VIISVDTSTPAVMRETARLGAGLINDVRSLRAMVRWMRLPRPVCRCA
jgi:dihydropteroate synthase